MWTPVLVPDARLAASMLLGALAAGVAIASAAVAVARHLGTSAPRRALHAFVDAAAAGEAELAERAAARVLSRNDR